MENIFIIDDDNKLYDEMIDLRPAVIRRIESNVCKIQRTGRNVHISSTSDNPSDNQYFIKSHGYTNEQDLYDKLILEHNNKYPDNILWRWPRADEDK